MTRIEDSDIRIAISDAVGQAVVGIEPMGGGCVSEVYSVYLDGGQRVIAKHDEEATAFLTTEADMLRYLATETRLPVPKVLFASPTLLLMEHVKGSSRFSARAEEHAAELLAALHGISNPEYGFHQDTVIGGLRQPNAPTPSWLDFFRDQRLLYMSNEAAREGRLPQATLARIERLCAHLDDWLSEPEQPSLLHGDVWTTNILADGDRITAFLDPAIYFGHPEIELAFTRLFGTFGRAFYDRYRQLRPIAPGFFEERCDLYNLYPLLVHVRLFGGSYVASVQHTLEQYGF
jgi:fructosamine-3-kinase